MPLGAELAWQQALELLRGAFLEDYTEAAENGYAARNVANGDRNFLSTGLVPLYVMTPTELAKIFSTFHEKALRTSDKVWVRVTSGGNNFKQTFFKYFFGLSPESQRVFERAIRRRRAPGAAATPFDATKEPFLVYQVDRLIAAFGTLVKGLVSFVDFVPYLAVRLFQPWFCSLEVETTVDVHIRRAKRRGSMWG